MLDSLFPHGVIIGFMMMVVLYTIGMFAGAFASRIYGQVWEAHRKSGICPVRDPIGSYGPWVGAASVGIILSYLLYHLIGYLSS